MKRLSLLIVALGFAAGAFAQQYRWVDKDGRVQYGDMPPPGVKATRIKGPAAGSAPAPTPAPAAKKDGKALSPEAAFQKRQKERAEADQKAAKASADEDSKRVNCEQSQAALRTLQSGQRISTTNTAGERVYLSDDEREREVERVKQSVKEWCPR